MISGLTSLAVFDAAQQFTAKWEGGLSDHPADNGGVTRYGVSLAFLKSLGVPAGDLNGDGVIDRRDVLEVTKVTAKKLFKREFWDRPGIDQLPSLISICAYDFAVNSGPGRAAIVLQQSINDFFGANKIAKYASNFGPLTRTFSLDIAEMHKQEPFCQLYIDKRAAFLENITVRNPSQKVFLKGWLNRTNDLKRYIKQLSNEWEVR